MLWQQPDGWDDIVESLLSDQDGYVVVLRAYVDASERTDCGLFSVAAYLFESTRVRRFRREWRDVFGEAKFSWADLIARSKPFKHLRGREHDPEHTALVRGGVGIVRDHCIAGSIVSCWTQDVQNFSPRWIRGFSSAYSICCHMCMAGMGEWAKRNNYQGGIAYILEAGDEFHAEADDLLSYAAKVPEAADLYQWRSHGFMPKDTGSPFHAPDLLAWEWGKFMYETAIERKRLMRLSLVGLLVNRLNDYYFQHLHGESFVKFLSQIRDVGIEQLQEQRAASLALQPSMDVSEAVRASGQTEPVGDPE